MALNILIAPDKFKGSLNSAEVCGLIEKGLLFSDPGFHITRLPMADGGDGLLDMVLHYRKAEPRSAMVRGPLSKAVQAGWLIAADGRTAYIEMAAASGLALLAPAEYDCLHASSYGVGELIREAAGSGVHEIIIGIGGSATNDGGMGMAAALGYRFLDHAGLELSPGGANLIHIDRIDGTGRIDLSGIRFRIACDVKNPLCGPEGATRIYAPQKGAGPGEVESLEAGMLHYSGILERFTGRRLADTEGAGAAGGMGAGCMAFLGAELVSGAGLAIEYSRAEEYTRNADIVITAEGKLDRQTLQGKLVAGIAALGKKYGKPVLVICGSLDLPPDFMREAGITAAFSIVNGPISLERAMQEAGTLLYHASCNIGALLKAI